MRRVLRSALTLLLAISVAGCGGGGGTSGGGDGGSTSPGGTDEIATIEELAAAFESEYGAEAWYAQITGITLETMLGTPVIAVRVSTSSAPEDYEAFNASNQAISDALSGITQAITPNAIIMFSDGAFAPANTSSSASFSPMNEVYSLPPAPTTPGEVRQWLESVYGPGGLVALGLNETWYGTITEVTTTGSGSGPVLVVRSSAPSYQTTDAQLIDRALQTSGSPMLERYSVMTADGGGTGASAGSGEPGSGASWFYPAP